MNRFLKPESLGETLDAVNDALFHGESIPPAQRRIIASWVASRQGVSGSYRGMFAPTAADFEQGVTLFTGEKINTGAGTAHILGQEACRALRLLRAGDSRIADALGRASSWLAEDWPTSRGHPMRTAGTYCCGKCSVALWRHLAAWDTATARRRIPIGIRALRSLRDGAGRWRVFPFWYTVLALTELNGAEAIDELKYAAPALERAARRSPDGNDRHAGRRLEVARRALALACR
jgi:hypothetical protein